MAVYTSTANVKNVIGSENLSTTLTDAMITVYITRASGFIDSFTGTTFAATPDSPATIEMACANIAAAYCLVRTLGGRSSGMRYTLGRLNVDKGNESRETRLVIDMLLKEAKEALGAYGKKFIIARTEP